MSTSLDAAQKHCGIKEEKRKKNKKERNKDIHVSIKSRITRLGPFLLIALFWLR